MIKLSIIVPVYNVSEYIDKCIDTIFNQSLKKHYEVIFVNDGSTDGSSEILLKRCHGIDNIKIFNKENGGLSSARNYGISQAEGEYISFLDSDDWIDVDYVKNILSCINEYKADLYYFDRAFVRKNEIKYTALPHIRGPIKENYFILPQINISACNKVYNKRVFQNNLFPLGVIYEDVPFMFNTYKKIECISKVPGCLYYVRQTNPNSITSGIHRQEIDMLTNLESVRHSILLSDREFLKGFFYSFEVETIISWSMKLLRGKEMRVLSRIDFSKYDKKLINGFKNKLLFQLLLNKNYRVIRFLLLFKKLKDK
ncbi:glycosyltransferase family 2 protein [Vibrio cholerae]|nr:glycosyltransferase family 2 protein [Vibrio cholerae]ELG7083318.1 glycosyltransferase family 2 protein [Vibrio cholerae]